MTHPEFTFVLNPETANSNTYQTWVTVRVRDKMLERKSNEEGNGQTWVPFGYGSLEHGMFLFQTNEVETQAARIVGHVVRKVGRKCNVLGFGAAWSKAKVVRSTINPKTGRKLTAAPSIRETQPPRDKNVKARRWNTIDIHAMHEAITTRT